MRWLLNRTGAVVGGIPRPSGAMWKLQIPPVCLSIVWDRLVNEIICDPQELLASPPYCVLANHASNMHPADCGSRLWDS